MRTTFITDFLISFIFQAQFLLKFLSPLLTLVRELVFQKVWNVGKNLICESLLIHVWKVRIKSPFFDQLSKLSFSLNLPLWNSNLERTLTLKVSFGVKLHEIWAVAIQSEFFTTNIEFIFAFIFEMIGQFYFC